MPTATAYFGYTITNVGSPTGAITVAPSCITGTDYLYAAHSESYTDYVVGRFKCDRPAIRDCFPNRERYPVDERASGSAAGQGYMPFYSPASECPSGWTTAGVYAEAKGSASASSSGVFTQDLYPYHDNTMFDAAALPILNAWTSILDPQETVILCCPSNHVANIHGGCVSSVGPFSSYNQSTLCNLYGAEENIVTVTSFQGSAWDPPLISMTPAETQVETVIRTPMPSEEESYVVVHHFPALALVHRDTGATDSQESGED